MRWCSDGDWTLNTEARWDPAVWGRTRTASLPWSTQLSMCLLGKNEVPAGAHGELLEGNQRAEIAHRGTPFLQHELSCFCIHHLHLYINRYGLSFIASFRLHLVLNWVHRVHTTEDISRAYMGRVDKIGRLADHTPIYTSPPLRLRLLSDTAVEAQPEFTHD